MTPATRIAVVGAGAVGGCIGARLARAGAQVTVVDRGRHLRAIQDFGLRLVGPAGEEEATQRVAAYADAAEAGEQDFVLLGVKSYQIADVAFRLSHLCRDDTTIVTLQNGLPWWYFQRHGGELDGRTLESVDPGGQIASCVDPYRVVGCIVHPAMAVMRPGVVQLVQGRHLVLGELDGASTSRITTIAHWLQRAGFVSTIVPDIRNELWLKLWGNLSFNPISALTRSTLVDICRYPSTRSLAAEMMREAQGVAERLGVEFRVPIEKRIEGAEKVGAHKTSMLHDLEQGRRLELDSLLASVIELGEWVGVDTPRLRAVHACAALLDATSCVAGRDQSEARTSPE